VDTTKFVVRLALFVLPLGAVLIGAHLTAPQVPPDTARFSIAYATFIGGSEGGPSYEEAREVIPEADGSVVVGAMVKSRDLPVSKRAFQKQYAGDDPNLGHPGLYGGDCYVGRLSPDGSRMLCATYFGGSKQERNTYGLELDKAGNIVVTTSTASTDIPTTPGGFQPKPVGGNGGIAVAKLSADCTRLIWCTYLSGSNNESPRGGLALDRDNNVVIVGTTNSADYPTTPGVLQPRLSGPRDSLITKLKADGSGLVFSTLLGGTGEDDAIMGVRLDAEGNIYVAGHTKSMDFPVTPGCAQARPGGQSDCYLAKLNGTADRILYATYLGGNENEWAEHRPWLNPDGTFLLAGYCGSADFPVSLGAYPGRLAGKSAGFLVKLAADGTRFAFATLLGGSGGANLLMPTPDKNGNIWVVGSTAARDLPVTPDALQKRFGGGRQDGVLAAFSPDGSRLVYCTYLGGEGDETVRSLAWGPDESVYLVGSTSSPNFPATPGALQTQFGGGSDAFVVKLVPNR
jgi:hypothetical protein